jgi:hypothetical protein
MRSRVWARIAPSLLITVPVLLVASCLCRVLSSQPIRYGMHTLRGSSEEFALVHEAGFRWVVQVFSWREIAPWRGLYNWEQPDAIVRGAEHYDLEIVARLDQHPDWSRSRSATNGPPDDLADYGDFVHAIASRYKGHVRGYVIWNEPNLAVEWGGDAPDPEAYADMLRVAYTRIKEADPAALVVSAGLAPTNEHGAFAMDDRLYLERMYDAGARQHFDVLGAHAYGFGHPPDDLLGAHQGLNLARIQNLRDIMVAYGDEDKPVWITELGWTVYPPEEQAWQRVSPGQQADYLVEAFRIASHQWPWVQLLTIWNVGFGPSTMADAAGYSLVESNGEPRPAFNALSEMPKRGLPTPIEDLWQTHQRVGSKERPRALAEDVVIHLGDNHWPTPWVPLYQGQLPSPVWTGEFYLREVTEGTWTLHMEVMQTNERTNYLLVNGHPVDPPYLPVEDYSRSWVALEYQVPADHLRPGPNEITVVVGKEIPPRHRPGTYEDLQFRDIVLTTD